MRYWNIHPQNPTKCANIRKDLFRRHIFLNFLPIGLVKLGVYDIYYLWVSTTCIYKVLTVKSKNTCTWYWVIGCLLRLGCIKSIYQRCHCGLYQVYTVLCFQDKLLEKCSYSELFWSAFSRVCTEYGEILRISPYLVRIQEYTD